MLCPKEMFKNYAVETYDMYFHVYSWKLVYVYNIINTFYLISAPWKLSSVSSRETRNNI